MAVSKRNGSYYIRFTKDGVPYSKSMGKGATKEEAIEQEAQMRREIRDIEAGHQPNRTIDEAIVKWIDEYVYPYKGSKGLSRPKVYVDHANYVLQFTEDRLLTEVTDVAREMLEAMREHGYAAGNINQKMNILKRPTSLAYQDWEWLKYPITGQKGGARGRFPTVGKAKKDIRFLTRDEIDLLVDCCDDAMAKELIYFLAYTGVRWGEFARMDEHSLRKDLRTKEDVLLVEGKGYKDRVIPLQAEQLAFVKAQIPFQGTYGFIRHHLNKAKAKAGLDITPHGLRHSYGTMISEDGVEAREVMQLMGHTTMEMYDLYTQLSVGHLRGKIPKQNARPESKRPATIRPALRVIGGKK